MRGGSPKCDLSLNALPDGRLRLQVALVGFDPPLARALGVRHVYDAIALRKRLYCVSSAVVCWRSIF